jgi:hypothetical protein
MISVIVCSRDDAKFAAVSAEYDRVLSRSTHEIVRIGDARSMCEGYNRGISLSRGETLIFSHDDIRILCEDLAAVIEPRLKEYDVLGVAGTSRLTSARWLDAGPPHLFGQIAQRRPEGQYIVVIWGAPTRCVGNIQAVDGVFMCASRRVAEALRFDEATFRGFHLYDLDFSYRAFLGGFRVAVCADIHLIHHSSGAFGADWEADARRFLEKHGGTLSTPAGHGWQCGAVWAATDEELREIMNPPHWPPPGWNR